MLTGRNIWQSTVRKLLTSLRSGSNGRRLRTRRATTNLTGWAVAAEVMEPRTLLSSPAYGQGFSAPFQDVGTTMGSSTARKNTLVTDAAGNVYVAMACTGTGNISPTGTDTITATNVTTNLLAKYSPSPSLNLQWALVPDQTGSTPIGAFYGIRSMAVGALSQDLYVTGRMSSGTLSLPTNQGTTLNVPADGSISFVARLDHNTGNVVWLADFTGLGGSPGGQPIFSLATDAAENVYLSGSLTAYQNLPKPAVQLNYVYGSGSGGVPVTFGLPNGGGTEFFVKFDGNGNALWGEQFTPQTVGTTTGSMSELFAKSTTVDSAGNIYWTGKLTGTVDADPSSGVKSLTAINGYGDIIIEKIDTNGHLVWVKQNGSAAFGGSNSGQDIQVDASGNVNVDFYGHYLISATKSGKTTTFVSANLVQFDNNGNLKWYQSVANGQTNNPHQIFTAAMDPAGNIYVSVYRGYMDKYSPSGALIWSIASNSPGLTPPDLAIDNAGDIWWASGVSSSTGQINVSPTSTPAYLPTVTTGQGTFELVEWTQPGGYAAAKLATGATQAFAGAAASPSTVPSPQQVIFVGDVSPAPTTLPAAYDPMQQYRPLLTF